jgi:hypothetical protein
LIALALIGIKAVHAPTPTVVWHRPPGVSEIGIDKRLAFVIAQHWPAESSRAEKAPFGPVLRGSRGQLPSSVAALSTCVARPPYNLKKTENVGSQFLSLRQLLHSQHSLRLASAQKGPVMAGVTPKPPHSAAPTEVEILSLAPVLSKAPDFGHLVRFDLKH